MLNQVIEMHKKFGIDKVPFSSEEKKFRIDCLQEEIDEYASADNPADELDALIDLVVFALGTADRQGFSSIWEEAFRRVQVANCSKEVGPNTKRGSFAIDLKKPEGWKAPNFDDLLENLNA